jgi:putative tryptophan/tyrosine transport system substrate-binding protein
MATNEIDRTRRVLICALPALLLPTHAEADNRVWRVGVLTLLTLNEDTVVRPIILPELAKRGFVEGRNLQFDLRVGTAENMLELAQALVADNPDVIVAMSDWALHPARAATTVIPIVAAPMGTDPVKAGVAQSWAHPGRNVTGVTLTAPELEVKRLTLSREAVPSIHRVALLSNHHTVVEAGLAPLREASAEAGLELVEFWAESPSEYRSAFGAARTAGADALVIVPTPEMNRDIAQLAAFAREARLPTIGGFRKAAEVGLLIGYGPNLEELERQAAEYVVRILNGAKAGELPFQGPTRFELALNLRTAKALGLTIPPSLLARADEVIE